MTSRQKETIMRQQSQTRRGKPQQLGGSKSDVLVQDFLDQLALAQTKGDTRALATLWGTPTFVIGDSDERVVQTRAEIEQFFGGAKQQYNARGIVDTRADIQMLDWITDKIAMVRVRWPYLDADDNEVGEEMSTYVLKRDDNGDLKLRVAVMHGEAESQQRKAKKH